MTAAQRREYNRVYYEANREREKERARSYRQEHREQVQAKDRARYQERREWMIKYQRAYSEANPQVIQSRQRAYYEANRGALREQQHRYATEGNPEAKRASAARYRARKWNADVGERINRQIVFDRDQGICGICGQVAPESWHLDHIRPLSRGGLHTYDNVQVACPSCNSRKGQREMTPCPRP